jgi:hypothetical protein
MATKPVKKKQLYEMIRKVNEGKLAASQRLFNGKRMVRYPAFVANITAEVAGDRWSLSVKSLRSIVCKPK